jgi:hypothetical protein
MERPIRLDLVREPHPRGARGPQAVHCCSRRFHRGAANIDDTCAALETGFGPDPAEQNRIAAARKKPAECDDKLAKYRQALESGTDPTIVEPKGRTR